LQQDSLRIAAPPAFAGVIGAFPDKVLVAVGTNPAIDTPP
jgi:hypothetical protein